MIVNWNLLKIHILNVFATSLLILKKNSKAKSIYSHTTLKNKIGMYRLLHERCTKYGSEMIGGIECQTCMELLSMQKWWILALYNIISYHLIWKICYQIVVLPVQRYIDILYDVFLRFFPQYIQYSGPYKLYHEDTTEFIQDDV